MIDINQEDFGVICVCALRYCHGRRTYMPSLVQEIVMAHFKDLSDKDLESIRADAGFQEGLNLWGDECDKRGWMRFYDSLDKYRAEHPKQQTDCLWK